jgi:hypothetical protein
MRKLTIMAKIMMKMAKMMVWRRQLAVAGGSGGGQQMWQLRGLSVNRFFFKLDSGCCWLLVRGRRGGRQENKPKEVSTKKN